MEDLTLEDLLYLAACLCAVEVQVSDEGEKVSGVHLDLWERLTDKIEQLEELNNLDLDDCAGGACKL
jgi:hypothetical protein